MIEYVLPFTAGSICNRTYADIRARRPGLARVRQSPGLRGGIHNTGPADRVSRDPHYHEQWKRDSFSVLDNKTDADIAPIQANSTPGVFSAHVDLEIAGNGSSRVNNSLAVLRYFDDEQIDDRSHKAAESRRSSQ